MEKKEIVEKISSNSKLVNWLLETVEMKDNIKKELKEDLKRKRRSYDKMFDIGGKKIKAGN